jgi:uncharacterized protein
VYGALAVLFATLQRKLIYPRPAPARAPAWPGAELVRIPHETLGEVLALYRPAAADSPVWVHFHGNGEQLADTAALGVRLSARGLGFFGVEYPGYGLAPGSPSEETLYAAAIAAVDHLERKLGVPPERIVLAGQSLGSGVAMELAHRGRGARVVLVSPFTSMGDMAARVVPWLPARWLVVDRFDSLNKADRVRQPTLLVHGDADTLIPIEMSRVLHQALPRAELHVVGGAEHNDVWATGGAALLARVATFCRGGTR